MALRLAWLTDIHLDFLQDRERHEFLVSLGNCDADAFLVGGDIGHSRNVASLLAAMAGAVRRPLYFVLGNHDFYGSSVAVMRAVAAAIAQRSDHLRWLTGAGLVPLTARTGLVGHEGWADGRLGDYVHSTVELNDYLLIADLAGLDRRRRLEQLKRLGDEAAAHLGRCLPTALDAHEHVLLLTHVPPFREACWYRGRTSGDEWVPHLACGAVGALLLEMMARRSDRHLTVLCGHTHGAGSVSMLPNLVVHTGGAEYGSPAVQRVLDVA